MKISQKAFEKWLSAHPRRRFRVRSSCMCPIAGYLRSKGHKYATVGIDTYYLDKQPYDVDYALPEWARRFIGSIDGFTKVSFISGRDALKRMKEVDLS